MLIRYVYPDGFEKKVNTGFNYFLPSDAKLIVSGCEYITVNDRRKMLGDEPYSIDYAGEDLDLEYNGNKFYIRAYGQKLDDNTRFEYSQFSGTLEQIIQLENNNISSEKFVDILNHDEHNLNLCTFGRNVEEMRGDKSLEDILKHMKHLKQVFTRPKSHLREEMELLPVEVVTRISHETIQHLASHSENCEARRVNGLVPSRLLAKTLEEDWAIYENVVAKNLVDRIFNYVKKYRRDVSLAEYGTNFSLSVKNENKNVYVAQDRLYKGFISGATLDDAASDKEFLSKRREQCKEILKTVVYCRESKLYRILKKCKKSYSPLKSTNIFMMDTNYHSVYELWKILDQAEFNKEKVVIPNDITKPYWDFSYSLLNFALNNFNFSPLTDDVIKDGIFQEMKYSFKHWNILMKQWTLDKLNLTGISLDFSLANKYIMPFNLEGAIINDSEFVTFGDREIVFSKIPSDDEITELGLAMFPNKHARDNTAQSRRRELRQVASDFFRGKTIKKISTLLLPLPVAVPQTENEFDTMITYLKKELADQMQLFDFCYILMPQRPSDNEDFSKKDWSKKILHYPETQADEKFGIFPVTLSDIDSYRRFTKVILRHMIDVDEEHKLCPVCGDNLIYTNGSWECNNLDCAPAFTIRKPLCDCGKEYIVTHYNKSHSFSEHDIDSITNQYELFEIKAGFKNYTSLDTQLNPICPHCKQKV